MIDTVKANEGVVSTIGDTDLVMVCATGGGLRPISFANLMAAVRGRIQINGRNLLLNSSKEVSTHAYLVATYKFSDSVIPQEGEVLTATIWGNLGVDRTKFVVYLNDGYGVYGSIHLSKVRDGVYQGSGLVKKTLSEGFDKTPQIEVYQTPKEGTSTCTIQCIKVSYDNIASSWSPAPEDLRGGVIGYMPITYNLAGKGGAHDGYDNADCAAEGGADGHLSFRSLGALAQFIGRACEDEILENSNAARDRHEDAQCGRCGRARYIYGSVERGECPKEHFSRSNDSDGFSIEHISASDCEIRGYTGLVDATIFTRNKREGLVSLGEDLCRDRVADRKEVAYV